MFDAEGVSVADGPDGIVKAGGLVMFLRSLVGLDRKAAKQAINAVTEGPTPISDDCPYTNLNDLGISAVFPEADDQMSIPMVKALWAKAVP